MITFDDFKKVEMKVGEILSAEKVEGSDKLLKLSVNFGLKPSAQKADGSPDQPEAGLGEEADNRQVISGIGKYFPDPSTLIGKRYAFVTNLEPRNIMGLESQAMIIAASTDDTIAFFDAGEKIPPGTPLK
jgi:tRNA-binding EMAP/Myf-like protein